MSEATPWLKSRSFDLIWIIGPGLASILLALTLKGTSFSANEFLIWIIFVVGIDVTHVYCTLFRTYMNPRMREKLGMTLFTVPLLCGIGATLLHTIGGLLFWRAMAYLAVFHFIRQQEGFLRLYQRQDIAGGLKIVERIAIWLAMVAPLAYWHTHLPREFHWFVPDDFVFIPWSWISTISYALLAVAVLVWLIWFFQLNAVGRGGWRVRVALIGTTFLVWNCGIVWMDNDFVFSVTNIMTHGIPYMALIWVVGSSDQKGKTGLLKTIFAKPEFYLLALFALFCIAWAEEYLWRSGPSLQRGSVTAGEWETFGVAILAIPQLTHYVLDGIIWKRPYREHSELLVSNRNAEDRRCS